VSVTERKDVDIAASNYPAAREGTPSAGAVTVLAVTPYEEDQLFLGHLFSHSNWRMYRAHSSCEALALLRQTTIPVVLCESEMPDSSWKSLLAALDQLPDRPLLVVTSRLADEHLGAEVLNLGGYDVLMKPFDPQEVVRVISPAWLRWKDLCLT
jgi:DNA-binding response OmpR family regulator